MQKSQQQVREFHDKFNLTVNGLPTIPDDHTIKLRCRLLMEEVLEFCEAAGYSVTVGHMSEPMFLKTGKPDLILMSDALADIQYVNDGAANSLGIDLEPISNEVHRSNMSKLWSLEDVNNLSDSERSKLTAFGNSVDGYCMKDKHGKVIKSSSYSPADIKGELIKQGVLFSSKT